MRIQMRRLTSLSYAAFLLSFLSLVVFAHTSSAQTPSSASGTPAKPSQRQEVPGAPPAAAAPTLPSDLPLGSLVLPASQILLARDPSRRRAYVSDYFVTMALKHAPTIRQGELETKVAEWEKFQIEWLVTPSLSANLGLTIAPNKPDPADSGKNWSQIFHGKLSPVFFIDFEIIQPLYSFGRLAPAVRMMEAGIEKSKAQTEGARREVEFQVRRAYAARQYYEALSAILKNGTEVVGSVVAQLEKGRDAAGSTFDLNDFGRLQMLHADLNARKVEADTLGGVADDTLQFFTGAKPPYEVLSLEDDLPSELPTLADALAMSVQWRPEKLIHDANIAYAANEYDLAKRDFYPYIGFVVRGHYIVSWSEMWKLDVCKVSGEVCQVDPTLKALPAENPLDTSSFVFAIAATWTFDFPQQYGRIKETEARLALANAKQETALADIRRDVQNHWKETASAKARVEVEKKRLEAARKWRDQAVSQLKEVAYPLNAYYEAYVGYVKALYDYKVAYAALEKSVGIYDFAAQSVSAPAIAQLSH